MGIDVGGVAAAVAADKRVKAIIVSLNKRQKPKPGQNQNLQGQIYFLHTSAERVILDGVSA